MTTACGICGKHNRKNAKFCVGCAARLGIEPVATSIPGPAFADSRRDAAFDSTRTGHSRPSPLRAAAPTREPAMFWLRAGIAGLVLLIGFVGWCMYVLTSHKAVAPLQATTNAPAPADPPVSTSALPVPAVATPAAPSAPTASSAPAAPAAPASSRIATVAPAAPIASAAKPSPATGTEADASIAAPHIGIAGSGTGASRNQAAAVPRSYARERTRRPEAQDTEASGLPPTYSWSEPARQPANTLHPGYADPGPPVVPGPGPRYASSIPSPVEVTPTYEGAVPMRGPDAGPPVVPGPGPRYDFSSPGAIPR